MRAALVARGNGNHDRRERYCSHLHRLSHLGTAHLAARFATTTGQNRESFMADDRDDVEREHTTIVETGGGGGGGILAVVLLIIVVLVLLYVFRGQLGLGHSTTVIPNKVDVNINHNG
jgi:hypothetical protein